MRNNIFITKRLPLLILFLAFSLFMLSMVGDGRHCGKDSGKA